MNHAESRGEQPPSLAEAIAALHADREVQRLALAEAGMHPAQLERTLHRDSLKQIARLAARYGQSEELLDLLAPAPAAPKKASLQVWGEEQYKAHGSDDARMRQLPRGDRD